MAKEHGQGEHPWSTIYSRLLTSLTSLYPTAMTLHIKPHFAPVTSRSCFSPERVLCAATFASRTIFEPEGPVLNAPERAFIFSDKETTLGGGSPQLPLVSKPKDANRLSEGHNLRKFCLTQFQWGETQFYEVQVSDIDTNT
jgi:hypothetical protein